MTQATPLIGSNQSGLAYRTADNDAKKALLNHHKGATAPSYAEAGIIWIDDTATPWKLKIYDGADWIVIGAINPTTNTLEIYHGAAALRILNHAADTGSANAYAVAPSPPITAYATGQIFTLKPGNANTGASTVNVNSVGTKNIKLTDGSSLPANAMLTTGTYILFYDGTDCILLNPNLSGVSLSAANTWTKGQSGAKVAITSSSNSTALDLSNSNFFELKNLAENTTLANPTNAVAGQSFEIDITQDTTGSRTMAYAWGYEFAGGAAPALSTAALSRDALYGTVRVAQSATVTMTIASPGVITYTAHGLVTGQKIQLTTTGALPTGLSASTTYYVIKNDANSFWLATSLSNAAAGTKINTSGSQSGTHTLTALRIDAALAKGFA